MTLKVATTSQYVEAVKRAVSLGVKKFAQGGDHPAGFKYVSLLNCFFLHLSSALRTMLRMYEDCPKDFPVTNAYVLLRSMLEVNIIAHYIARDPRQRAAVFIEYGKVIERERWERVRKHKDTDRDEWREFLNALVERHYRPQKDRVEGEYNAVKSQFEFLDKHGKRRPFKNWANKDLCQMAKEVEHELEYDVLYRRYCEFTHPTVRLADRFLKTDDGAMRWSTRAEEPDVAFVFRDAGAIYCCFLQLFGKEFNVSVAEDIKACWDVGFKGISQ